MTNENFVFQVWNNGEKKQVSPIYSGVEATEYIKMVESEGNGGRLRIFENEIDCENSWFEIVDNN